MPKQIIALLVLLAILVGGLFVFNDVEKQASVIAEANGKLLENTSNSIDLNSIQSIQISRGSDILANARSIDGNWFDFQFNSSTGFPLQSRKLASLLRQVQSAEIVELKSADPNNHAKLGLVRVNDTQLNDELVEKPATVISIVGNRELEILIGKTASIQQGQFVRFASTDQTYLVDQEFTLPTDAFDWLNDDFLNLELGKILEVNAYEGDSLIWQIHQQVNPDSVDMEAIENAIFPEPPSFDLLNMAEQESLAFDSVLLNYIESLEELRFTALSYMPTSEALMQQASLRLSISLKANKGAQEDSVDAPDNVTELLQVAFSTENEQHFVHILAIGEREYLNAWRFEIPSYQAENLLKVKNDFLGDAEAE